MARYARLSEGYDPRYAGAFISVMDRLPGVVYTHQGDAGLAPVARIHPDRVEMFDVDLEDAQGRLPHEPGYRRFRVIDGGEDATPVVPLPVRDTGALAA